MTVYAVTYSDKKPAGIERGKRYKVDREIAPMLFYITADNGGELACLWYDCAHLGGGSWTRIKEEDDMAERITLQKGDYVSTKGLSEDDYHAVAKAFMAAGAEAGEYPCEEERKTLPYFGLGGYGIRDGKLCHAGKTDTGWWFTGRHLTPAQVIGAVNGGTKQEDTLTAALQYARDELANAERCEAQAAEHRANHDGAMERVRDMLPEGWRLVRDTEPDTDMSDPANWREGDVVTADGVPSCQDGKQYELKIDPSDGELSIIDDDGDWCSLYGVFAGRLGFRFHHRP